MCINQAENELFKSPLHNGHIALKSKMVPFAGWLMPLQYEGIIAEHIHTRKAVSLFDICHMGEFAVRGSGASAALDRIFPRSVSDMKTGSCRYNFLLTERGTVADDLIIYRKDREDFLLVVNASRRRDDFNLLSELLPSSVEIADVSDQTAKLDLQGPESAEILISAGIAGNELPGYYRFREFSLFGVNVIISRTGYTGELGYELYFDREKAAVIWNKLLDYPDVRPAGLGARDTLRLEMGYPLYGHELNTETTPLEAGFSKLIKLEQNREFTGKNALINSDVKKKLSGIMIKGRRACRQGAEILYNGTHAGYVTSGGFAPSLSNAVALGYIDTDINPQPGMLCQINTGRAVLDGKLVELPFYKKSSLKSKIG